MANFDRIGSHKNILLKRRIGGQSGFKGDLVAIVKRTCVGFIDESFDQLDDK